jgi:hypothetical protein
VPALQAEVITLKRQVSDLEIQKAQKQEEFSRGERELRHKVGLEKNRQEVELAQARREAVLDVREANLAADRKRFEEHVKFIEERFADQTAFLKDSFQNVLSRLPNVNVDRVITERKK